jgi:hypothetical protein
MDHSSPQPSSSSNPPEAYYRTLLHDRLSGVSSAEQKKVLFWAFDFDPTELKKHPCVRVAAAIALKNSTVFSMRSSTYASIHFARHINEKNISAFDQMAAVLDGGQLILFLAPMPTVILTLKCRDSTVSSLLSSSVPLFAVLGDCDRLRGYEVARRCLLESIERRTIHGYPELAEPNLMRWAMPTVSVQGTLKKYLHGHLSL